MAKSNPTPAVSLDDFRTKLANVCSTLAVLRQNVGYLKNKYDKYEANIGFGLQDLSKHRVAFKTSASGALRSGSLSRRPAGKCVYRSKHGAVRVSASGNAASTSTAWNRRDHCPNMN